MALNVQSSTGLQFSHQRWWLELEDQWKKAFNEVVLNKGAVSSTPTSEELEVIVTSPVLRFAGPRADFPNMSFELTNLSGIKGLPNLEILVAIFHQIKSIRELASLPKLKSLFLNNNLIESLKGIEELDKMEMLYVNVNQIESIEEVKQLTNLKEFYCNYNRLSSLKGINLKHEGTLKKFFPLPNDDLSFREVQRVEQKIGIKCREG